ncbi:MAG TPA: Sec-independent protein translocase protein TatB [Usitatibacter sp.]|nr:Sec-independent protein translocase protein TatB [Usitatibacter sp.]
MFDVGFSEMLVIGIVALVVIGPEKLPKVARTLGHLFGRLQRYVSQVKTDISREMEAAELGKVKTEFETAARSFQADIKTQAGDVEREMRSAQESIERELSHKAADTTAAASPPAATSEEPPPSPQMELGIDVPRARDRAAP